MDEISAVFTSVRTPQLLFVSKLKLVAVSEMHLTDTFTLIA